MPQVNLHLVAALKAAEEQVAALKAAEEQAAALKAAEEQAPAGYWGRVRWS